VVGVGETEDESGQPASGGTATRTVAAAGTGDVGGGRHRRRRRRACAGGVGVGGGRQARAGGVGGWARALRASAMAESSARQRGKREMKRRAGPAGVKKPYVRRLPARPSDINLFSRASRKAVGHKFYFRGPAETVGHKLMSDGLVGSRRR
jgi:hypothetical protein